MHIKSLIKLKITFLRLLLLGIVSVPVIFINDFYDHFYAYLTGNVIGGILIDHWDIVLISIVLFLSFLIPLSYRRKVKWTEYSIVSAFFVSLFVEMYGIPFTILFAQHWFYDTKIQHPPNLIDFHLFGTHFGMDLVMAYAACLIAAGIVLIITAWITLYLGVKKQGVVMNGIYSLSRHPQYLGFIFIIVGWFIGWPTPITMIFAPILIYKYVGVCEAEEREIGFEVNYKYYKKNVPFLI